VRVNLWLSWIRRTLGIAGYWSLAGFAKRKVKTALSFIFDFEEFAVRHARERGLDGVICGHIHWATIKQVEGLLYANCGDWVDSCSAIVEHLDGRLELIEWDGRETLASLRETPASALLDDVQPREDEDAIPVLMTPDYSNRTASRGAVQQWPETRP
jgi:hypothetical protein